jgi:branched-subunit amino acid aminotransferase/4-amino-4-deoxychorismate lyase
MKQKELIFYLEGTEFKQSINGFVPFDERMIDRGQSIFDAIELYDGVFIYVDAHLERTYSATRIFGAPLEKIFSREEFKEKIEKLIPIIIDCFGRDTVTKLEIIVSRQSNVFLRAIPISGEWLDPKLKLVVIAIQYRYLLQSLKYCGRYAEPMIISELAKKQIDPEIEECLLYSKVEETGKNMVLEASNSALFIIDTENRLWGARSPDVLPSTTAKIVEKIAEQDMNDLTIPNNERISEIMWTGFPINTPGYIAKEIFSTSYSRLLPVVKKLIFVDVKNEKTGILIKRAEGIEDIIIKETPITGRLRERFQKEVEEYIKINKK